MHASSVAFIQQFCQLQTKSPQKNPWGPWEQAPNIVSDTVVCKGMDGPGQMTCEKKLMHQENTLLHILVHNYCLFTEFNILENTNMK